MDDIEQTVAEMGRRLAGISRLGSHNVISVGEVREWAVRYLSRYDDELARFPDEIGCTHWNFWMKDFEPEDATFAAVIFRPDGLEFFCGIGAPDAIKRFGESEFPDDPEAIPGEMQRRFTVPDANLLLDAEVSAGWLGRGGWCG